MTNPILQRETVQTLVKPDPSARNGGRPVSIRRARPSDAGSIDRLMKAHARMVGFMPMKQLEKRIEDRQVIVAEDETRRFLGYCLFHDQYFKREDVGIIYQLNVVPERHRGLVGAALVKAAFEHLASSVKLYCCWCAQDLEANHFWEAIGFVPLAFRAGSRGKAQGERRKEGRIHILWQKRIREGDEGPGATRYWFPSKTGGGAMREDRIALPIPPGAHWSDAMPMVVPGFEQGPVMLPMTAEEAQAMAAPPKPREKRKAKEEKKMTALPGVVRSNGIRMGPVIDPKAAQAAKEEARRAKREAPRRPRMKYDPKYLAAARALCDRYLEEVNIDGGRMLMQAGAKYEVSRQLPQNASGGEEAPSTVPLLLAA